MTGLSLGLRALGSIVSIQSFHTLVFRILLAAYKAQVSVKEVAVKLA